MTLYAFGSNGAGQLGLHHKDDSSTPQEVVLPVPSPESKGCIKTIVGGGSHTLLLFESGVCLAAGSDSQGQMGDHKAIESDGPGKELGFGFRPLTIDLVIKSCSALWEASALVTMDDEVFVTGAGPKGELGLGPKITQTLTLQKIPEFPPSGTSINRIASGVAHTVVLLSNGEAWGWGNGRKGQLGEPADIVYSPRRISAPAFDAYTADVACGREFSYFADIHLPGRHMILGSDKWNVVSAAPKTLGPTEWTHRRKIYKSIGTCWNSVVVLLEGGEIEAWGRNDRGQLPLPHQSPIIEKIATGSEHCVALTTDQEVLCCGWGEHGNCGSEINEEGNVQDWVKISLQLPTGSETVGVAAGCATSFFWTRP